MDRKTFENILIISSGAALLSINFDVRLGFLLSLMVIAFYFIGWRQVKR